jgi:hypothetical protein
VAGGYGWQLYHLHMSWNLGTLTSWNSLGHSRPVIRLFFIAFFPKRREFVAKKDKNAGNSVPWEYLCWNGLMFKVIFWNHKVSPAQGISIIKENLSAYSVDSHTQRRDSGLGRDVFLKDPESPK